MKKLLAGVLVFVGLLAIAWVSLLMSGNIANYSVSMILNVATGRPGASIDEQSAQQHYTLPDGFSVQIFANDLPKARFLRFTQAGDLLVSRPHAGDIVLLEPDRDGDGYSDARRTIISELDRPQGMDFDGEWLYIAERERIGRIRFDHNAGATVDHYEDVVTSLTGDGNHWSKTIRFGPDGMLYLAQGSTCNICVESDPRRATIMRFRADGSDGEIFATGLRNSVGFDWSPVDGALYATDNGRDMLGDNFPPCELNRVELGNFYGWPYFNGNNVPDKDMGPDPLAQQRLPVAPVHGFRAHNAPLGISFVDGSDWPGDFDLVALVALHGSWNRSEPDGYEVVSLHFSDDGIEERTFLGGFNQNGNILGRPVDVIQGPDGAIYISDDYAGAIYRVSTDTPAQGPNALDALNTAADTTTPDWVAQSDVQALARQGAALYQQHACSTCHEQGENPLPLVEVSYDAVERALVAPQAPMPLLPLSETERRALAAFIVSGQ
ncbi:oxidoreductase [Halioglobus sp. HI00S01]|uniref:PQQ-dependent sugar dehydrogenase n=1 Tax=Halioglobus sp. HI00S01 TaxID=1822214 RepID=UPI0007C255EB|nr:PQQ-dependent sugar dehydrogenase [Halioglobus sp. HI00S01]KZX60338.1 oxidoreductase [Halioglobus sp. HI00S01]